MSKKVSIFLVIIALVALGAVSWYVLSRPAEDESKAAVQEEQGPAKYSAEWFVELLKNVELPNLQLITSAPVIKGSQDADQRIREIAEKRGYKLEKLATGEIVDLEQVRVQKPLVQDWNGLKAAAKAEADVSLTLISGFRSVESQRSIFVNRLDELSKQKTGKTFTNSEIATGQADTIIDEVLAESSPPGYSEHHSGYAIDIEDTSSGKPFDKFGETKGFEWLSKDNYENARRFGFVPGYPAGVANFGPNPEPWHIVWVGTQNLQ